MIYRAIRLAYVAVGAATLLPLTHSPALALCGIACGLIATAPAAYGRASRLRKP
jgi:hypothetical protein